MTSYSPESVYLELARPGMANKIYPKNYRTACYKFELLAILLSDVADAMATLSRKHDSPVRCIVTLLSVSNSETEDTARFLLTIVHRRSRHEVIRTVTRVLQEQRTTNLLQT